jgi:hypothetical protein
MLRRIADGTEDWVNGVLQHDEKPHPESLLRDSASTPVKQTPSKPRAFYNPLRDAKMKMDPTSTS